jgi:enamine deaminase RidA (YjgF/YER057c/UK114 family)
VGPHVHVSGTVAPGPDAYAQAAEAIRRIEKSLNEAGAELRHVVRTRMFVTDIDLWQQIGTAHHEFFGEVLPATSMIEVSKLIGPEFLVEIEAEAYIDD